MTKVVEHVRVPAAVHDFIVAHARAGKPEEICGVVRGRGLLAYEAVAGRNIAAERIENYEVDPQTLLLQFAFEDAGDEMMGIYHSHPVSVAYPSATDAWNAHYPECIYFICSLEFDDAPVIRAFRMTPHWLDVDGEELRAGLSFYETRPHLFAYYQAPDAPLPPHLVELLQDVPAPFYIDLMTDDHGAIADISVVSLVEYPVQKEGEGT
jgi:[CysO sulfur-carrier protein]-S-L-cysteine hydrolase